MDERPAVGLRGVVVPGVDGSISFDLAAGDCVVLLDADSARRTALLQVIAGVRPPTVGTVDAGGCAALWHDDAMPDDVPVVRTLAGRLRSFGATTGPRELLEGIGLAHRAGHEPWAMSLGERRRIGLEAVFASSAPVLVLDEPERGLDMAALRWLRGRIRAARHDGRVVLVATHDAALAEACGDFVIDDLDTLTE